MDVVTYALCKKLVADATGITGKVFNIKGELPSVDDLPTSGNTGGDMYLIGPNSSGTYDEYYWLDTKNKWEFLGNTGVDMSEYITKAEADKKYATLDKVEQLEEDNDLVYMLD